MSIGQPFTINAVTDALCSLESQLLEGHPIRRGHLGSVLVKCSYPVREVDFRLSRLLF